MHAATMNVGEPEEGSPGSRLAILNDLVNKLEETYDSKRGGQRGRLAGLSAERKSRGGGYSRERSRSPRKASMRRTRSRSRPPSCTSR